MGESGSASIEVKAPPEKVLRVVTEIEAYPQWMDPFKKVEVLERDGAGRPRRAAFEMDAVLKVVNYVLEYSYADDTVAWTRVEGDMKEIAGSYTLEGEGERTKVTYAYSIDPGIPVPAFLMRQGVRMMVNTALGDLKRRVESLEG